MQVVVDQVHDHHRHLVDHRLALHWKVVLANRPRVLRRLLESEGVQFGRLGFVASAVLNEAANFGYEFLVFGDLLYQ